jgi:hypothetical protein
MKDFLIRLLKPLTGNPILYFLLVVLILLGIFGGFKLYVKEGKEIPLVDKVPSVEMELKK